MLETGAHAPKRPSPLEAARELALDAVAPKQQIELVMRGLLVAHVELDPRRADANLLRRKRVDVRSYGVRVEERVEAVDLTTDSIKFYSFTCTR